MKKKTLISTPGFTSILSIIVISIISYFVYIKLIGPNQIENHLKKNGISTTAILLKSEQTGFFVGDSQPQMRITLKLNSKEGESWEAETEKVVSLSQLYLLKPGTIFNVIYDPKDKTKIMIVN